MFLNIYKYNEHTFEESILYNKICAIVCLIEQNKDVNMYHIPFFNHSHCIWIIYIQFLTVFDAFILK